MFEQETTHTGQTPATQPDTIPVGASIVQRTLFSPEELAHLTVEREQWEQTTLQQSLARIPERANLQTTSSVPVARLYTPIDTATLDYQCDLGLPGAYPYTRGVQPTMYRAKPWTMRMFAGFGTAEDTNARFHYLLKQGQTGLSTAFDMATLYGYDTDHPLAAGEFGKCGVADLFAGRYGNALCRSATRSDYHLNDDQ